MISMEYDSEISLQKQTEVIHDNLVIERLMKMMKNII